MQKLDRSFFKKVTPISALTVTDHKQLSNLRRELIKSGDLLGPIQIRSVRDDETTPGAKCLLLRQGIDPNGEGNSDNVWNLKLTQCRFVNMV